MSAEPTATPGTGDRTEPARLTFDAAGRARSTRFGDMYQPDVDGAQARAVFLAGNGLPERWASHRGCFTVLELGFGTGLNCLETWRAWTASAGARATASLAYVGLEGFPLTRAEARSVYATRSGDAYGSSLERLLAAWPEASLGAHSVALGERAPTLTVIHEDFERALAQLARERPGSIDAFYLDGFSPACNPGAWNEPVFAALARLAAPGATAATWSVAGAVRRGLAQAGFEVSRRPGHGPKRERLEARRAP